MIIISLPTGKRILIVFFVARPQCSINYNFVLASRIHLKFASSKRTEYPESGGYFSHAKAVYMPKHFFPHAASLDQAFAHCRIFSTAATRRCKDRISVPSLGAVLSPPLPVIALVGFYPANKLIGPRPLPE